MHFKFKVSESVHADGVNARPSTDEAYRVEHVLQKAREDYNKISIFTLLLCILYILLHTNFTCGTEKYAILL